MTVQKNTQIGQLVTIVIKTFERPDMITRCIASLRQQYPSIPVIIADDSETPTLFPADDLTKVMPLPFDSGISKGRNLAINEVQTPYYILIDDDHVFEKDANIEELVSILENTDFDIVAFRMMDYRPENGYCRGELHFAGIFEIENSVLRHFCEKDRGSHLNYPIYDIVLNCYAARTANFEKLKFDENIKIGHEHSDYFLGAKALQFKITKSRNAYVHHRPFYNAHYKQFRKRTDSYKNYYYSKHSISKEETIGGGYRKIEKLRYLPHRVKSIVIKLKSLVFPKR